MGCVQTITNNCGSDIHLDYLNDTEIWADCMDTVYWQLGHTLTNIYKHRLVQQ